MPSLDPRQTNRRGCALISLVALVTFVLLLLLYLRAQPHPPSDHDVGNPPTRTKPL